MLRIKHYQDIEAEDRDTVLQELFQLGFVSQNRMAIKRELGRSQEGKLPQLLFLFRGDALVGYVYLMGEQFSCWAMHNLDELPSDEIAPIFAYAIRLCEECGCLKLKSRLEADPSYSNI